MHVAAIRRFGFEPGLLFFLTTIVTLTAGTVFLMWVGEQISVKGIGNGVSLLIFLNVISRGPANIVQTIQTMSGSKFLIPVLLAVAAAGILTIMGIVVFQLGQRKFQFTMWERDLTVEEAWDKIRIFL